PNTACARGERYGGVHRLDSPLVAGAWDEKGRISSLVAMRESPCFEGWPAAAQWSGRRLTGPYRPDERGSIASLGWRIVDVSACWGRRWKSRLSTSPHDAPKSQIYLAGIELRDGRCHGTRTEAHWWNEARRPG